MSPLLTSWARCWQGLAASGDGAALREHLVRAWGEPQRKYHTLQHLTECQALLDRHLHLAEHPAEVEMALWFHDAVYDVTAKDNEARSAALAAAELGAAGVAAGAIDRIRHLIMATCHSALPEGTDQQLLVDVDLSILGASRPRFTEYEQQVRAEYQWVPEPLFRERRRATLQEFLHRSPIYHTPALHEQLEKNARDNLRDSLSRLEDQPGLM